MNAKHCYHQCCYVKPVQGISWAVPMSTYSPMRAVHATSFTTTTRKRKYRSTGNTFHYSLTFRATGGDISRLYLAGNTTRRGHQMTLPFPQFQCDSLLLWPTCHYHCGLDVITTVAWMSLPRWPTCHYHCGLDVITTVAYMSLPLWPGCHYYCGLDVINTVAWMSLTLWPGCHYHCGLDVIITVNCILSED